MAVTVRIEPTAHAALSEIARAKQLSLTEALSRAVEAYRREVFLEGCARDFAALRGDAGDWADEVGERSVWDASLADGLEGEPRHPDAPLARRRPPAPSQKRHRGSGRKP